MVGPPVALTDASQWALRTPRRDSVAFAQKRYVRGLFVGPTPSSAGPDRTKAALWPSAVTSIQSPCLTTTSGVTTIEFAATVTQHWWGASFGGLHMEEFRAISESSSASSSAPVSFATRWPSMMVTTCSSPIDTEYMELPTSGGLIFPTVCPDNVQVLPYSPAHLSDALSAVEAHAAAAARVSAAIVPAIRRFPGVLLSKDFMSLSRAALRPACGCNTYEVSPAAEEISISSCVSASRASCSVPGKGLVEACLVVAYSGVISYAASLRGYIPATSVAALWGHYPPEDVVGRGGPCERAAVVLSRADVGIDSVD